MGQVDLPTLTMDQFSFIDIETQRPLVTIGSKAFIGQYQDTVGSSVFFTRPSQHPQDSMTDDVFGRQSTTYVTYLANTRKSLQLSQVFLTKKEEKSELHGDSSSPLNEGK